MPDRYGNDHVSTIEYGIRATKLDPLIVLMTMSAAPTAGLASTCSTTYYELFDVARRFATLDLMTNGARHGMSSRQSTTAGSTWAVKSTRRTICATTGPTSSWRSPGHWDAWDDGAIIVDRRPAATPIQTRSSLTTGAVFTRAGVHRPALACRGAVIIQAGAAARAALRGRRGEVISPQPAAPSWLGRLPGDQG
jgi:hypothetical protein